MTRINDIVEELKRLNLRQTELINELENIQEIREEDNRGASGDPAAAARVEVDLETEHRDRGGRQLRIGDEVVILTRGVRIAKGTTGTITGFTNKRVHVRTEGNASTNRVAENLSRIDRR